MTETRVLKQRLRAALEAVEADTLHGLEAA